MTQVSPDQALNSSQGLRVQGAHTMRLPWRFDVVAALDEARRLPSEWWSTHFNQNRHDGGWQALALRVAPNAPFDVVPMDAPPQSHADAPALEQCPSIRSILETLALPFKSVRLMQLLPSSEILEHMDAGVCAANGEARLHIPLQTDEQVFFHIDSVRIPMRAGECWYTDVALPHRVRNRSGQTRIHLVADVLVDMRLFEAFRDGDAGEAMSDEADPWNAFVRFRDRVFGDATLASALMDCQDLSSLSERSVELGRELGYSFDASDVESAMRAGRRSWVEQWIH